MVPLTNKLTGDSVLISLQNIRIITSEGTDTELLENETLQRFRVDEPFATVMSLVGDDFLQFTHSADGKVKAINKAFIEKVIPTSSNKAVIITRLGRGSNFQTTESFAAIQSASTEGDQFVELNYWVNPFASNPLDTLAGDTISNYESHVLKGVLFEVNDTTGAVTYVGEEDSVLVEIYYTLGSSNTSTTNITTSVEQGGSAVSDFSFAGSTVAAGGRVSLSHKFVCYIQKDVPVFLVGSEGAGTKFFYHKTFGIRLL